MVYVHSALQNVLSQLVACDRLMAPISANAVGAASSRRRLPGSVMTDALDLASRADVVILPSASLFVRTWKDYAAAPVVLEEYSALRAEVELRPDSCLVLDNDDLHPVTQQDILSLIRRKHVDQTRADC